MLVFTQDQNPWMKSASLLVSPVAQANCSGKTLTSENFPGDPSSKGQEQGHRNPQTVSSPFRSFSKVFCPQCLAWRKACMEITAALWSSLLACPGQAPRCSRWRRCSALGGFPSQPSIELDSPHISFPQSTFLPVSQTCVSLSHT